MNFKKILTIVSSVALMSTAQASTISVTKPFTAGAGVMAVTAEGVFLTGGGYYIGIGTFASLPVITDFASLFVAVNTDFLVFGSTTSATAGATQGFLTASITNTSAAAFNAKEVYLVIGNAATLALSTQFAILRHTPQVNFAADASAAGSTTWAATDTNSFAAVTNAGTEINDLTAANRDGIQLVGAPIPEPSQLVLLVLGLALASRRKRS